MGYLGRAIDEEIARSGRLSRLDRLRGELEPAALFQTVPGIGPVLADEIHDTLEIDTLEALELTAHDGRLETVKGIGHRRIAALRANLADLLGRQRRRSAFDGSAPPVETILDVDLEYRRNESSGRLPRIAPRRFNPDGKTWLPILHTDQNGWHFTALYSNTARAHHLGRTKDWVVTYFYDGDHQEGQATVVTEARAPP